MISTVALFHLKRSTKAIKWACVHYVMVSKFQWKPFWLATQRDQQNDHAWTATQNRVNNDVFAQAPLGLKKKCGHF